MTFRARTIGFFHRIRWALLVAVILAGAVGADKWMAYRSATDPTLATRPFRIGFENSPPHQFVGADGKPQGPVIDIISEAARRIHIPIVWVRMDAGPEVALTTGKADLWPLVAILPERKKLMYISNPWLATSMYMVTLQASHILTPAEAGGHTLARDGGSLNRRISAADFPNSRIVLAKSAANALSILCRGGAEIAIISGSSVHMVLRDDQSCADKQLWFYPLPNEQLESGVAASLTAPGASRAADEIRKEIAVMATEGIFASSYFRWTGDLNSESAIVQYMENTRRQNRYLIIGMVLLGGALGLLVWETRVVRAARKTADLASRAKSEFLANMSHEIRTPMNGVIGMTDLAMEAETRAEQREYLELVKMSGAALLTIVNDILDFSKIEAGKLELDPIPFAVRDIVFHALRTVALRAHQKGIELVFDVADDVPSVLVGDPDRLRQIILNLVGNAVKFTEQGEVALRAILVEPAAGAAEAPVTIQFSVRDTGIGIAPDKLAAVFAAFSQADTSTTRRFGGTGLGLTISKQLVTLMGGKIWIESKVGEGTTTSFTANFTPAKDVRQGSPDILPRELSQLRTLIVDDNATNRRILTAFLDKHHMTASAAESGAECFAAMERQPFDLILLDVVMPEMDGFEVAAQIRQRWPESQAKILMLSSLGHHPDLARCRELGIQGFSSKPVRNSDLLATILGLFGRESGTAVGNATAEIVNFRKSLRVLLAEDNLVNQTLARRILSKSGHVVTIAGNGREAVEAFVREPFDLILMDIQMPDMDGFAATATIRGLEFRGLGPAASRARVPIIALTAHAMAGDREKFLAGGMDAYVSKPIHASELLDMIQRVTGELTRT